MQEMTPERENFQEWLLHPVTKSLRDWAKRERGELMEQWANGMFSAAFDVEMAVKNAGATGACSIYQQIIDLDYQQIMGEVDGK